MDFRLCTFVLPGVSGVFFESVEGKELKSFRLHRAVSVLFGVFLWERDTRVPLVQTCMGQTSSALLHSTSKADKMLPFLAGGFVGQQQYCGTGSY